MRGPWFGGRAFAWGGALLVAASVPLAAAPATPAEAWVLAVPEPNPAKPTTLGGISGLVRLGPGRFVTVHDAKRAFDPPNGPPATRLHRLDVQRDGTVQRHALAWNGPVQGDDLEALEVLPGAGGDLLALESGGDAAKAGWIQLRLGPDRVDVRARGALDGAPPQVEGLALVMLGGRLLAAWAGRGHGATPAELRWGFVERGADGLVTRIAPLPDGHAKLTAPWLSPVGDDARHVSDLALTACGDLWTLSARDPGNDGPFLSLLWHAGRFSCGAGVPTFAPDPCPTAWRRLPGHKAEGLVLTPRGPFLASDDENRGGWLLLLGGS